MRLSSIILRWNKHVRVYHRPQSMGVILTQTEAVRPSPDRIVNDFKALWNKDVDARAVDKWLDNQQAWNDTGETMHEFLERFMLQSESFIKHKDRGAMFLGLEVYDVPSGKWSTIKIR